MKGKDRSERMADPKSFNVQLSREELDDVRLSKSLSLFQLNLSVSVVHKVMVRTMRKARYFDQHRSSARMSENTTLAKKKNHHRDLRREERCSTCDIMLDQARSAQGKSDPPLSATFALR